MKLTLLGTRGEIELRSPRHRLHSSLLVLYRRTSLVVDCGLDWLERMSGLRARALLLTHAHPDHAGGLRRGAPWPVYATEETWRAIERYPIALRGLVPRRQPFEIEGIGIEALPLEQALAGARPLRRRQLGGAGARGDLRQGRVGDVDLGARYPAEAGLRPARAR